MTLVEQISDLSDICRHLRSLFFRSLIICFLFPRLTWALNLADDENRFISVLIMSDLLD
jgi:abortive infection bacteriophage resistance protein